MPLLRAGTVACSLLTRPPPTVERLSRPVHAGRFALVKMRVSSHGTYQRSVEMRPRSPERSGAFAGRSHGVPLDTLPATRSLQGGSHGTV